MKATKQKSPLFFRVAQTVSCCFFLLISLNVRADSGLSSFNIESSISQANAAARIKNYTAIHTILLPLAETGNAEAQYRLAGLYNLGRGVVKDPVIAFSLFQEAAQSGLPKAQYQLGVMYEKGRGVEADQITARHWFEQAGIQGHALAQRKLEHPLIATEKKQDQTNMATISLAGTAEEVLRWAARRGLLTKVNQLLETGISPDGSDQFGRTALIEAAAYGHDDVMLTLLQAGADVTLRDKFQVNALLAAVERKNHNRETISSEDCRACIELLLQHGADINTKDRYGNTPFIIAAKANKKEILTLLANNGANIHITNTSKKNAASYCKNNKALEQMLADMGLTPTQGGTVQISKDEIIAQLVTDKNKSQASSLHPEWSIIMVLAWRNNPAILSRYLQKNNADINKTDGSGYTALCLAAEQGSLQTTKILLDYNADPSLFLNNGMTPLHLASKNGHLAVAKLLVSHKALIDSRNEKGETPLILALENNHNSIAESLLDAGANGKLASLNGNSPLILAAAHDLTKTFSILLMQKVNVNHAAQDGTTALITAAKKGHESMVEMLLSAKAQKDQADYVGNNALSYATANNHLQIVSKLIAAGANINQANKNGNPPLLLAASKGNTEVIALLIKAGAKIDQTNNIGNSALMLAVAGNHVDSVLLLLKNNASLRLKNKKDERVASLASGNKEIAQIIKNHSTGLDWVANFF